MLLLFLSSYSKARTIAIPPRFLTFVKTHTIFYSMKKHSFLSLAVLAVFAGSNCLGAIDGALSLIADVMGVSQTTALYVGSVATLVCMLSGVVIGAVAGKKLPYKRAVILCYLIAIISGVGSALAPNFVVLLLLRCAFGFGVGGIMCVQNPIATILVSEEKRARILGIGTCVAFGSQSIMQLVGGVLADRHWNFVFLTYFLLLIPFALVVRFLPTIELTASEKENVKSKPPLSAILMCIVLGIGWLNIAPLLFGSAFYVAPISDSATMAAVIAMMFSIGCMVGGLLFSVLYRRFGRYSYSVFLLIAAVGLFLAASAKNIPLLAVGFFISGVGQSCMQAGIMFFLGLVCDESQMGIASALFTVLSNLGAFLCSAWDSLLGVFTGDTLYFPLYLGVAIFVVIAVIFLIRPPEKKRG